MALLDVDMPEPDGLSVAATLHKEFPQVKVIIVTTYGRPGWVKRALDAGVSGFMVKDAPVDRLAEGIRRVMAGLQVIDPELVVESTVHGRSPLTERETEVLRTAADGGSVDEIASTLYISSGTVRNRLSSGDREDQRPQPRRCRADRSRQRLAVETHPFDRSAPAPTTPSDPTAGSSVRRSGSPAAEPKSW